MTGEAEPVGERGVPDWHAMAAADVVELANTGRDGLSAREAARRLERHGPNRLPQPRGRGALGRLAARFNDFLIWILLASAAITAAMGHWIDTGVILAVVAANTIIGFVQEGRAERALDAIRHMLSPRAVVLRDGVRAAVPGEEVVPGDVVLIEAGDRVPADLRLIEARGLHIEEAVLTGESAPAGKSVEPVPVDVVLGDRASMAYSGTMVSQGAGRGVVVATGAATEIGRISGLLAGIESLTTPLLKQMDRFARWLSIVIVGFALVIFLFGYLVRGYPFVDIFVAVVGLTVAAIPEGLPAILTVTLAIGVQGMARRSAVVRRLPAIETLGSVSVICSDKTGTLTRNEMAVVSVVAAGGTYRLEGTGYEPAGTVMRDDVPVDPATDPSLREIGHAVLLCNDAVVVEAEGGWRVEGDPMEGALVVAAARLGLESEAEIRAWPRHDAIPFDARHRFMATHHRDETGTGLLYVKGAPERLIEMCAEERDGDGGTRPIDAAAWHSAADAVASAGQRVLAVAARPAHHEEDLHVDRVGHGLVLLGLVGMIDPPREEAIAAVADCRRAGIAVKMITGDHPLTAAAIARSLGLDDSDEVVTGRDVDALDEAALRRRALTASVFARTSPEHKLRLVAALQAEGRVVAMTGDGVNDAPALKRADIGIAMGLKGSEAAKEAADMVLLDDNFATLAAAVRAGRTVYDNLKKAIAFLLPINGGESMSLIAAILLGVTLPITPVQILWVNLVSSVVLAMSLAFEPAEPDVMRRPPRDPDERILSSFLVWRVMFVSILFVAGIFGVFELALSRGADVGTARTMAVNALVVMEIFYLFAVRYLDNPSITFRGAAGTPAVLIVVAAVTGLQFLFTYAPFMHTLFGTRALSPGEGATVVLVGAGLLVAMEIEKGIRSLLAKARA